MKTLVTGATGLLGNNVVRHLLALGRPVRALVRATSDPRPLAGLDLETVSGDVRDGEAVRRAVDGCGAVVHAAGDVWIGWTRLQEQREVNVVGTRNVVEAAEALGAQLVHVSSVNALGLGTRQRPADENTPLQGNIRCSYVVTKQEAEQLVFARIAHGLRAIVVNPGYMLGPWDWKPSSGRMLLSVAKNYLPLTPRGGCSLTDVRDVAAAVVAALDVPPPEDHRYILAGHNLTYFELWSMFARISGSRPPLMRMGPMQRVTIGGWIALQCRLARREPEVNTAMMRMSDQFHFYDSGRARRHLGYAPRAAEVTITDAWNWLREYGFA